MLIPDISRHLLVAGVAYRTEPCEGIVLPGLAALCQAISGFWRGIEISALIHAQSWLATNSTERSATNNSENDKYLVVAPMVWGRTSVILRSDSEIDPE